MVDHFILRVVVAGPLRGFFDYLAPPESNPELLQPGVRLRVPFGRGSRCAILLQAGVQSELPISKLKPVEAVLDPRPFLSPALIELLVWSSRYYQHPLGDVFFSALPTRLRRGEPPLRDVRSGWRLTPSGRELEPKQLARAPRQQAIFNALHNSPPGLDYSQLTLQCGDCRAIIRSLIRKGLIEVCELPLRSISESEQQTDQGHQLNPAQLHAASEVSSTFDRFQAFLLHGVTGSGKTEVYLNLVESIIQTGKQALILVPEIGLTPQLMQRFQQRLMVPLALLHSSLPEKERELSWSKAMHGEAAVIIGTRSSIFTPMPDLGLIIVDEEHDPSFKQQEGFRYSARDLAVVRAHQQGCPVLLGSATPSLESLHNVHGKRYQLLELPERAGSAKPPRLELIDIRNARLEGGLSPLLRQEIGNTLVRGQQVMLFLNRRGYAPVITCHACGWLSSCTRCDSHMTFHSENKRLCCHHCGHQQRLPEQCPSCGGQDLRPLGHGTERLEEALKCCFPLAPLIRIDRDNIRRKGALQQMLQAIQEKHYSLLIGTQMLAKGHHFPEVTLVGIIDMDQGLFGIDYRASERMAQMILQVAGRAGRADKQGRVLIQTRHPDHPLLHTLIQNGYSAFAHEALSERKQAALPPFSHQALLRAEAIDPKAPVAFLQQAAEMAAPSPHPVEIWGPVPAPMERRAGRTRAHLLLQSSSRATLQAHLAVLIPQLSELNTARRVRWSVDVDPQEMI